MGLFCATIPQRSKYPRPFSTTASGPQEEVGATLVGVLGILDLLLFLSQEGHALRTQCGSRSLALRRRITLYQVAMTA